MDNETKELLQMILKGQEEIKQELAEVKQDISGLKEDVATLKEDVSIIKENAVITRHSVNLLLTWAEKADRDIKIGLYQE